MKRIERKHPLDKGMQNWIIAYAEANLWRVPHHYQWEDLIQEGYLCYCKCRIAYPNVEEPKHFMALVKRSFVNRITDLSRNKTSKPETVEDPSSTLFLGGEPQDIQAMVLVNQLPIELKNMLILFISGKAPRRKRYRSRRRETNNQYLCKTAGLDPEVVDVEALFKQHMR